MNREHLSMIQEKAQEIRSHTQLKKVWELRQSDSDDLRIEENQSTWDLTLAPMIANLMMATGLSQLEVFNAIETELATPLPTA